MRPSSSALRADIIITAAAPSLSPEALPAVTVPSLLKAGLSSPSASTVVPGRMNSSESNSVVALREATSIGAISDLEPARLLRGLGFLL